MNYFINRSTVLLIITILTAQCVQKTALKPTIDGEWWQVAGNPDLGELTTEKQEPVDFGIWQAADGSWQLWSCIRKTNAPGNTRLFYRWQGSDLKNKNWQPMGIAMTSDTTLGEALNGLQAPHVIQVADTFCMFYGDWNRICLATSEDGINFERLVRNGSPALFGDPQEKMTRDPMVIKHQDLWYCYYTANPNDEGAIYVRTSNDLLNWSESEKVAFGGQAGTKFWHAECPQVIPDLKGFHYLFRTQSYGRGIVDSLQNNHKTSVYRSQNLFDFGINDDQYFIGAMKIAAPEIFKYEGGWYVAALMPNLQGIRIAKLKWIKE